MKRKNIVAMVTSLALVGVVAVGGTLALLTAPTNDVVNTFAVGKGYDQSEPTPDVYLDEAPVTQSKDADTLGDYVETTGDRVEGNTYDKLVEGAYLAKDPQFHIDEKCQVAESWIVAKVSGFNSDPTKTTLKFTDVTDETVTAGVWHKITEDGYEAVTTGNMGDVYYIYSEAVQTCESTADLFQQLQVDTFVFGKDTSPITVTGCAVEGVEGAAFEDMRDSVVEAAKTQLG